MSLAAAGLLIGCAGGASPTTPSFAETDPEFAETGQADDGDDGDDGNDGSDDDDDVDETTTGADDDEGSETTRSEPVDEESGDEDAGETGPDCPVGSEGCPCTLGGACDPGLGCVGGQCVLARPECGNGIEEEGEQCDHGKGNGDNNLCKSDCTAQTCGDGDLGPGEACDDGNLNDLDRCSNSCSLTTCGDEITQEGEECDDGNEIDTDSCLSTCLEASCGDGAIHTGFEECDDGNDIDTDACLSTCDDAECGDSIVWTGNEECDDGNVNPSDGCTDVCNCEWDFESPTQIAGWNLTGGWGTYTTAPVSELYEEVPFTTFGTVFGTDGNRVEPYPGDEEEVSTATTADFVLPTLLEFRSWNVDEGGGTYDQKRIELSTDGGMSWELIVDCQLGPNDDLAFCNLFNEIRAEDDWDDISIDISTFEGMTGRIRFSYDSIDACCGFEQGWYIDAANLLTCQ